jgi:hypothetical protein
LTLTKIIRLILNKYACSALSSHVHQIHVNLNLKDPAPQA